MSFPGPHDFFAVLSAFPFLFERFAKHNTSKKSRGRLSPDCFKQLRAPPLGGFLSFVPKKIDVPEALTSSLLVEPFAF